MFTGGRGRSVGGGPTDKISTFSLNSCNCGWQ